MNNQEDDIGDTPLCSALDIMILMHRDTHFGGQFDEMLRYYREGGKGTCTEFDIQQIENLHAIEKQTQQNLAGMMLAGPEAEKVSKAKEAYKRLRDLYEIPEAKSKLPTLIADLILSEDEEAEEEITAVIKEKETAVPSLLELLRAEDFYDPLFPGYGQAPALAAKCLGLIGDKRAIITIFESIGEGGFFHEDAALHALRTIGTHAKEFLLRVLKSHPINNDNERAAIALATFKDDPEVAQACFELLKEVDILKNIPFATYLILCCEGLKGMPQWQEFTALADDPHMPKSLQQDIKALLQENSEG